MLSKGTSSGKRALDVFAIKTHKIASLMILGIISLLCGVFTSFSWTSPASALSTTNVASSTQDVTVTLGATILMRILDSTATTEVDGIVLDLMPTAVGTTVSDSVVVDVATSNASGYTLYMNSDYIDQGNYTTNLVGTTGAIQSKTELSNSWNYGTEWSETISDVTHSGSTTSQIIPANDNPATLRDDVDEATNSSKTTVTFNVNADTSIPAGVYRNKLIFTAIATSSYVGYNLYFNDNGGTGGPGSLTSSSVGSTYTFTIPDTIPTNGKKRFVGWATSPSATTAEYTVGSRYTITASGNPPYSETLYAVWSDTDFWSITYMQEMTPEVCNSVYTPAVTNASTTVLRTSADTYTATADGTNEVAQRTLYDIRDNNSYIIRKLADGNCWMTSNLQLQLEAGKTYENWGSYNDGTTFDLVPVESSSTTSSWYECGTTANGACAFNGNTTSTGGFYTWYAATGGKGLYSSTGDVNGSICPVGWKLPYNYTVDNSKSYGNLLSIYGMPTTNVRTNYVARLEAVPLSFSRDGRYYGGVLGYNGYAGYYWSSTVIGSNTAYELVYHGDVTYPQGTFERFYGFSIRCITL